MPVDTPTERSKGYAGHGQFLGRVVNTEYHSACTRYLAILQKAIQAGGMVGFGQEFPIPIAEFLFLRAAEISADLGFAYQCAGLCFVPGRDKCFDMPDFSVCGQWRVSIGPVERGFGRRG